MFPPLGLTIANPHRVLTRLDTTATVYTNVSEVAVSSKATESEAATVNVSGTAALRFSDPDGIQQGQEYEVANGLSQQAPTIQKFKGPFFTESKPTAHDPTVSLSVHVSEEEKLLNWFRDGHRPTRQREYATTLVSAATAGGKGRWLGAIGDAIGVTHNSYFENTTPFVRLYEGLSEYIEEYRNGSGGSYFNKNWKAAPPQLRDLSTGGNNSYFADAVVASSRLR